MAGGEELVCSFCSCGMRQSGKWWSKGPPKKEKTIPIIFVVGTQGLPVKPLQAFFF